MPICTTRYPERLKALKLLSLQRRRDRYLIICIFKIKNQLVPNSDFTADYSIRGQAFAWKPRNDMKNGRYTFYCMGPKLYHCSFPERLRRLDDMRRKGK